jgi:hypothetical protein
LALAIEWVRGERLPEKRVHPVLLAAALEASPEAIIRLIESGCDTSPDLCRLVVVPPAAAHKLAAVARGILEIYTAHSTRPDIRVHRGGRVRLWWTQEACGRQPDDAGTD